MENTNQNKQDGVINNPATTLIVGTVHTPLQLKTVKVNGEDRTVGNMSIVATRSGTAESGNEWTKQTYYDISAWGKLQQAELGKLKKGDRVVAQGQLEAQGYEKDGNYNISLKLNNATVTALGQADVAGVQKITALGRATRDPELKQTKDGEAYVSLPVALNLPDGKTTYINIETFGETAENIAKNVKKGGFVNASGDLELNSFEKGEGKYGSSLKISKANVVFFDKSAKTQKSAEGKSGAQKAQSSGAER